MLATPLDPRLSSARAAGRRAPSQNVKWTPLMGAAANGHPSTVQKLLAAGADPTLKDQVSVAAVAMAREGVVVGRQG